MGNQVDAPEAVAADRVRRGLVQEGLLEAITLSLGPDDARGAVRLQNPLTSEHAWLRRSLLPGLVREVERNWSGHVRDVRLFEIGTTFAPNPDGGRPIETQRVALVITGAREPAHWTASGKSPDLDLWDLRGLLDSVVALANPGGVVQVDAGSWTVAGLEGRAIGRAGPLTADAPRWAAPLYGLELELAPGPAAPIRFRPIPGTPASERDLALLVPEAEAAVRVLETIRQSGGPLLESARPVDEYRGTGVPNGFRSLAVRLTFRAADRTLRDQETDAAVARIMTALEKDLGISLRTT
jgi:phenylalanyl-tRNA synthetase beta chain